MAKSGKRRYKFIEVPDEEGEKFTRSECTCLDCQRMNLSQLEWNDFVPQTYLQIRMKDAVAKIEKDISRKEKRLKS